MSYTGHSLGKDGGLRPQLRCNWCILLPKSTEKSITGASTSDCFTSIAGHSLCGVGSFPSAETQSVYSTAPADWEKHYWSLNIILFYANIQYTRWMGVGVGGLSPQQRYNRCILLLQPTEESVTGDSTSYSFMSYAGHLLGSYLSAEMQSVYSTAPANWEKYNWNLTIILFMSWLGNLLDGGSYTSAEMQSAYSTTPADCTTPIQCRYDCNVNVGIHSPNSTTGDVV